MRPHRRRHRLAPQALAWSLVLGACLPALAETASQTKQLPTPKPETSNLKSSHPLLSSSPLPASNSSLVTHHSPLASPNPRGIPPDTLKPGQRENKSPPPASPATTPADPGAPLPPLPPLPVPPPPPRVGQLITPGQAQPPTAFNPDPGASSLQPALPEDPFFKFENVAFPRPEFDPVPADKALPRGPLSRPFLIPGTYVPVIPRATVHPGNFDPIRPGWETSTQRGIGIPALPASQSETGGPPVAVSDDSSASALKSEISNLKSTPVPASNSSLITHHSSLVSPASSPTRENLPIDKRWHAPETYPLAAEGFGYPEHSVPVPDRWRAPFAPWRRYTSGDTDELPFYHNTPELWHPYCQSILKGDLPIHGQDVFLSLTASSETVYEDRSFSLPSGASAARPGAYDFFGDSRSQVFVTNVAFDATLFKGETAFMPVEWAIKIKPVFNYNHVDFRESGIVNPDPRGSGAGSTVPPDNTGVTNPGDIGGLLGGISTGGNLNNSRSTNRDRTYLALQEAFFELHLRDLSPNYDFLALKIGNQTFNSDFRGFIFNDTNLGARLFGNYGSNLWQYNLALFDMREKDTNSELNTFDDRDQRVFIANVYRQDCIWKGYTTELSFHANFDNGGVHYDRNGSIVRPSPIGSPASHEVNVAYFGWAGDGHMGRWNISHALYLAAGRDEFNGLAGRETDILAHMAAVEVSYDQDWIRYKASAVYASGDSDAEDGRATGFDSIVDNTNFIGGPFSYYTRQGFNLAGTAVGVKQRFSLLPDLRTSKSQGQANFVNPGVVILGLGAEMDLTPKVRMFLNANHIRFAETDPLKTALHTNQVDEEFGNDLSIGLQWRPLLTDNLILSLGYGALLPGKGFKDIYRTTQPGVPGYTGSDAQVDRVLHSAVAAVTITF